MAQRITVFGGSQTRPGEPAYQDGLRLGKLLAQAGFIVLNGGYIGTMEAISRGATEAGGYVIGITCDQIEAWRPVKANRWVSEEWHYASLPERMSALIENCEGILSLPGGIGTLAEIMLTWNLLLTHVIPPRPLIVIGQEWQLTIHQFLNTQDKYIPEIQRHWISFAPDVDRAFQQLRETLSDDKL